MARYIAPMKDALIVTALSVVPKHLGSRLMGWFARLPFAPAVHRAVIRWFARRYQVDLEECEGGVDDFDTLADFFTRPLKPWLRPVDPAPEAVVSPVDARVYAAGTLDGHQLPADCDLPLDVAEMLGGDTHFEGGSFAVLYLSPRDYHRVHHPREGAVVGYRYLPGSLWPVFPAATKKIPNLFARNERLVVRLRGAGVGELAVVMVGAYGVGRMTTAFCELITNTRSPAVDQRLEPPVSVARGDELGRFNLGSTVILVAEPGKLDWALTPGEAVRMGQRIATLRGDAD